MPTDKSPGIAFLLSLTIPGLGQMYAGSVVRGLAFLAAALYSLWLSFDYSGRNPYGLGNTWFVVSLLVSVLAAFDAYFCAKRFNARHFAICPRCEGKNPPRTLLCLLCGTPLRAAGAAQLPDPPPPR